VVSIDPYEAYRQAIRAVLPEARIVVDHFHLVRGANTALDSVRRERQREHGRRKPKGARRSGVGASWRQDLYSTRHRLLKAGERLTARAASALRAVRTRAHDRRGPALKEAFRQVYRAPDRREAERRLDHFLGAVGRAQLPAYTAFADGVRLRRTELLAYFDEPTTNGYAAGVINKVKVIERRAYGLPTFTGFPARALLACA
jgi:transposase